MFKLILPSYKTYRTYKQNSLAQDDVDFENILTKELKIVATWRHSSEHKRCFYFSA